MSSGTAALPWPENGALADEQRRDDEDHLVAAAHGKGGRADPAEHSGMGRRRSNRRGDGSHVARALIPAGVLIDPAGRYDRSTTPIIYSFKGAFNL